MSASTTQESAEAREREVEYAAQDLWQAVNFSEPFLPNARVILRTFAEARERAAYEQAAAAICPWCDPAANHNPFESVAAAVAKPSWDGLWHLCAFGSSGVWRPCAASSVRALIPGGGKP